MLVLLLACTGASDPATTSPVPTGETADTAASASSSTGSTATQTSTPTPEDEVAACFAEAGLDGVCSEGELSWAVVGPQGCTAMEVLAGEQAFELDIDGDLHAIAMGDGAGAVRFVTGYGKRLVYPRYPMVGVAAIDDVPLRYADAQVWFDLPKDVSASSQGGEQVAGWFALVGGEIDGGAGFVHDPDIVGGGCFDLTVVNAGYFPK